MAKIPRFDAWHQAVVERELVGEVPALGDLDGVDLADEVRNRGVGRGELLREAQLAVHPHHGRAVALFGDEVAGVARHREVGIVADLGPRHHRQPLVEQRRQRPHDPGLGLPPLPQEDEVVSRQQCVLELGQHGVVEPQDPLHEGLPVGDAACRVAAELFVDGRRLPSRGPELAERGGEVGRGVGRDGGAHWGEPRPARRGLCPRPRPRPGSAVDRGLALTSSGR